MDRMGSFGRTARATVAAFGLAASVLLGGAAMTSAQPPDPEEVLSHFLCYEGDLGQFPGATVGLSAVTFTGDVRVGQARSFCNPVRKQRRDAVTKVVDIRQHLKAYRIAPITPVTGTSSFLVTNQFGVDQGLVTERTPTRLLVPTRKRPHDFPRGLDHFVCQRVVEGKAINKGVRLKDQFGEYGTRVLRPQLHCAPTVKRHGDRTFDVKQPNAHLVCYGIDRRVLNPPQTRGTKNQFEKGRITARVAVRLCVPSTAREAVPT